MRGLDFAVAGTHKALTWGPFKVLLFQERFWSGGSLHEAWVAQAVDWDICATGLTEDQTAYNFWKSVAGEIHTGLAVGQVPNPLNFGPPPTRFKDHWEGLVSAPVGGD